jgi:hypothetical protein
MTAPRWSGCCLRTCAYLQRRSRSLHTTTLTAQPSQHGGWASLPALSARQSKTNALVCRRSSTHCSRSSTAKAVRERPYADHLQHHASAWCVRRGGGGMPSRLRCAYVAFIDRSSRWTALLTHSAPAQFIGNPDVQRRYEILRSAACRAVRCRPLRMRAASFSAERRCPSPAAT